MFDAYALRMLMIKLLIVFNIRDVIPVPRFGPFAQLIDRDRFLLIPDPVLIPKI
jgi:hypothetical protein